MRTFTIIMGIVIGCGILLNCSPAQQNRTTPVPPMNPTLFTYTDMTLEDFELLGELSGTGYLKTEFKLQQ